jgi:CMP-N,N'-diacetyllegionaminic acid synthase
MFYHHYHVQSTSSTEKTTKIDDIPIDVLIPARSGSKGIPHKNIKPFQGKPLLFHSIDHVLDHPWIRSIYVSTDSEDYQKLIEEKYTKDQVTVILRPSELAQDLTSDWEVCCHYLRYLKEHGISFPHSILHLRPTFPIRKKDHLETLLQIWMLSHSAYDSCRSVIPTDQLPMKMYFIEDRPSYTLKPYFNTWNGMEEPYNEARQHFPQSYLHNGCYDITKVQTILGHRSMTGPAILPFKMKPMDDYDIDTMEDWERCAKHSS